MGCVGRSSDLWGDMSKIYNHGTHRKCTNVALVPVKRVLT